MIKSILRWSRRAVIAGAASVSLLLIVLYAVHSTGIDLPKPPGPYAVSRSMEYWSDEQRPDAFAQSGASRTELAVWIWYPSTQRQNASEPYLPAAWRDALGANQGPVLRNFVYRDSRRVNTNAGANAVLAAGQSRYPVVILRAGLGALTLSCTVLAESLASRGYVVIGFDAPYRTSVFIAKDGAAIKRPSSLNPETLGRQAGQALLDQLQSAWASDIAFVADRARELNSSSEIFRGRLETDRIAVVGHSLGGASALEFCRHDDRCAAAIDLDGAVYGQLPARGVARPVLLLASDHGNDLDDDNRLIAANLRSTFEHSSPDSRLALTLVGASHFNFSDQILLMNPPVRLLAARNIDPAHALALTSEIAAEFFNAYLKRDAANQLQRTAARPEFRPLFQ